MSEFLVLIAIGPVQEFIVAARRTRDLWYGSVLLSELSKACARVLHEHKATLIFPYSERLEADLESGSEFAVPNKILVQYACESEDKLKELLRNCESGVEQRLKKEQDQALGKAKGTLSTDHISIDDEAFHAQLKSVVEFYAAWCPTSGDYGADRKTVEREMAARKATRAFVPHQGIAGRPKSSLDGSKESVLTFSKSEQPAQQFYVRRGEHLDGIGLIKRLGKGGKARGKSVHFDSTHDVAAVPYVSRLTRAKPTQLADYTRILTEHEESGAVEFSYAYLYRIDDREIAGSGLSHALKTCLEQLRVIQPEPPYYALIQADGDGVGDAIDKLAASGLSRHQEFSQRLSSFAETARQVIKSHAGLAVYTGGDDVMALVPLHTALACAAALAGAFREAMKTMPNQPTLSAGMAVVHAMEPFSVVRQLALEAEKMAKKVPGKDALGIVVSPRSGADVRIAGKWNALLNRLREIIDLYNCDKLSKGLGHEFRGLLREWREGQNPQAVKRLAMAIAAKKQARVEVARLLDDVEGRKDLEELMQQLFVARPFARAEKEANAS